MFVLLIQAAPLHKRASGSATYYNVDVGVTSCGGTYKDTDMIVALNSKQMGNAANPNKNPNCGKKLKVKGPKGSVTVTIVDTCPGCSYGDLDLSPKAFSKIANLDAGRVSITWSGL
ncbi:RlpA-like double-psi beta-barrel-protein domain-containing protein-containing protein [Cunninghamella echinulata]|nr:RlpA-like double-psi beta-barrel-protein domain-containing protein-containing protein [Cunninghamella echinulata]